MILNIKGQPQIPHILSTIYLVPPSPNFHIGSLYEESFPLYLQSFIFLLTTMLNFSPGRLSHGNISADTVKQS